VANVNFEGWREREKRETINDMPTPKPPNPSPHIEGGTVTFTMSLQKLALHRWTIPHMSMEKHKDALYIGTYISGTN
jgi:hypothetical protein